jgi:hypothetical protein
MTSVSVFHWDTEKILVILEEQESVGVAPLKNKQGFLKSDSQSKANILNNQFMSVFTKEDDGHIPNKGPITCQT